MTRVNLIPVDKLYKQHLMAEYREIPMVLASLKRTIASVRGFDPRRVPKHFTLNSGHVTFFYDKLKWLHDRYFFCVEELRRRGFNIDPDARQVDWEFWKTAYGGKFWNDWAPNEHDVKISEDRIVQRVSEKPEWYKYD